MFPGLNPIPTRLCHMIYCCGDKSYPCLVGTGLTSPDVPGLEDWKSPGTMEALLTSDWYPQELINTRSTVHISNNLVIYLRA